MSANQAIAEALAEIAGLMELLGVDRFKTIAHEKAARSIESFPGDVVALVKSSGTPAEAKKKLTQIEAVGPRIADKIIEFADTGKLSELEELRAQVPRGLLPLMRLPGLGPKTLLVLWREGGVTDVASLKQCIDCGKILELPRMGEKSVAKLKEALAQAETSEVRLPLGIAVPIAEGLVERLRRAPGVKQIAYAGSLRRARDTIGDIDILVATSDPKAVGELFRKTPGVREVISAGDNRSSVRMAVNADGGRWTLDEKMVRPSIQVDLKVVPEESWGAALHYFTGSKDHNVAMRQRALARGLTLNDRGLYPDDRDGDNPTPPQDRGIKPVAGRTEEEVFAALGRPYLPPEIRENRGELALKETPRLVEIGDIKSELHAHTRASDGALTMDELAASAKRRGFHTVAVTDHSKSSAFAGGLSPERLREQIREVREANQRVRGIRILAGSEVDILADGRLDYDDELLAELDTFVASPHAALSQDPAAATARLLRVIEHPLTRIVGHPTGRLVNRRPGIAPDMAQIVAAAKQHNVALEINAHWARLDLRDVHVRMAVEAGCLIAINCDVHSVEDFECLRYGVATGRRGWLRPEQCVNTWDSDRLMAWLGSKGKGRG